MKRTLAVLLAAALLILAACSGGAAIERISDEEIAVLRAQYPYNDHMPALASLIPAKDIFKTFEDYSPENQYTPNSYEAVAVIRITGPWDRIVIKSDTCWPVFPATVEKVLWGGDGWKKGTKITVGFGADSFIIGMHLEDTYQENQRYVCFFTKSPTPSVDGVYLTGKDYTFYLTDQDFLLSVISAPGSDECTGLSLSAFEKKVTDLLNEE